MRDFTLSAYNKLINSIKAAGYEFQTFEQFIVNPADKVVVMRHDCDIWPGNDLKMALLENRCHVKATYYFRIPHTFNEPIIKKIRDLGHEIGYHYENLADTNGNFEKAIDSFKINLDKIRKIYPVRTIAMHGRPLSRWDSRLLWEKYLLEDFGIIGEPYRSVDYNKVLYLTDTGSRWDGGKVSIRDNVKSDFNYSIKTTFQLIKAFNDNMMPDHVIINAHAARWNDNLMVWIYRYFLQTAKNAAKFILKFFRH
jgi:hypothetical protein